MKTNCVAGSSNWPATTAGMDKRSYLCSGLVYCECGSKMHAHISKRKGHEYIYYRCMQHCGAPVVKMEAVDKAATRYLKELLSPAVQKAIHEALKKYQGASNNDLAEF